MKETNLCISNGSDKSYKPHPQLFMIVFTIVFVLLCMPMYFFTQNFYGSYITHRIFNYLWAFVIFIICYRLDFTILAKNPKGIYGGVLIVSVIALIISCESSSLHIRWISFGGVIVSLSYLSLIFALAYALFVYSMKDKGRAGILWSGVAYLPFAVIILCASRFTNLILYTIIALSILCFAICRGWYNTSKMQGLMLVLIPTAVVAIALLIILFKEPYIANRISAFLNPVNDQFGGGYEYYVIRDTLSQSVLFGQGHAIDVVNILEHLGSEFFLVYLIHQYGFIVLIGIILLTAAFSIVGFRKALRQKSMFGTIVSLAIILMFTLQAFAYIASNIGYNLVFSNVFPFLSYGGVNLPLHLALIGCMLSIFRMEEAFSDETNEKLDEDFPSDRKQVFSYQDGKFTIDFKALGQ